MTSLNELKIGDPVLWLRREKNELADNHRHFWVKEIVRKATKANVWIGDDNRPYRRATGLSPGGVCRIKPYEMFQDETAQCVEYLHLKKLQKEIYYEDFGMSGISRMRSIGKLDLKKAKMLKSLLREIGQILHDLPPEI